MGRSGVGHRSAVCADRGHGGSVDVVAINAADGATDHVVSGTYVPTVTTTVPDSDHTTHGCAHHASVLQADQSTINISVKHADGRSDGRSKQASYAGTFCAALSNAIERPVPLPQPTSVTRPHRVPDQPTIRAPNNRTRKNFHCGTHVDPNRRTDARTDHSSDRIPNADAHTIANASTNPAAFRAPIPISNRRANYDPDACTDHLTDH